MKRYGFLCLLGVLLLTGCNSSKKRVPKGESTNQVKYGVFLGCDSSSVNKIKSYPNVAIDLDSFNAGAISTLKQSNCSIYAYLSVGSLEKYRSYYEDFKNITFMDYENWPDERWVDVSNESWKSHLVSEANRLKNNGADGLFLDNFDVYYIANEEYKGTDIDAELIYQSCIEILSNLSELNLKIMVNSGTDFLERLHEENSPLLSKINVYCQECVFSSIEDYKNNVFGRQNSEDHLYYLEIIRFMRYYGDILMLEYTKDDSLKQEIQSYCDDNAYHFFISNNVDLKV